MLGAASRRTALGALAALCVTCQSQVSPPASHAEQDQVAPPAAPTFDPGVVRVEPDSPLGLARARLDEGDFAGARRIALAAIDRASEGDRVSLRWIAARAAQREGNVDAALESYASIPESHPLSRWARLAAAGARIDGDATAALELLAPLTSGSWTGQSDARALEAIAQARVGAPGHEASLRAAIERAGGSTRAELQRALAELLAARESDDAHAEAIELLRWIEARGPSTRGGREAATRIAELMPTLPAARRRTLASPSIDQQIARADALAAAMDHRGAEQAYAAIAPRLDGDLARRCEVRLAQGRAMYRRRARREAAALLVPLADECRAQDDVRAWARWYAAKSYSGLTLNAEAIAQYDVLAEELPAHRLADDALINAARLSADRDDADGMRTRLTRIVDEIAGGDMRGEARFLLAWNARREGRASDALTQLDAALAEGAGESGEDERGRAAYWRGRLLEQLDRSADAATQYESIARTLPLSYYAQQALSRLTAIDAARARAVLPSTTVEVPTLVFPRRPELDRPSFAAAIALLRAGEIGSAERELEASGLLGADASPDAIWIAAAMFDRAGSYTKSLELARRRLRDALMTSMPEGRAFALWRIAYPRAFHPLIETASQAANVPPSFVRAIAREESSFRPDAVSVAHAYGLCQIIAPTAQRIGRPLGIASDPRSLRTPEINVRIGAAYMSALRERFDPQPALVPAAYNAGEGAVERWLRERGDLELDEFIEEIPYDETRRYSRRVLQTWGIYAWLDGAALPGWPSTLPAR